MVRSSRERYRTGSQLKGCLYLKKDASIADRSHSLMQRDMGGIKTVTRDIATMGNGPKVYRMGRELRYILMETPTKGK